MSASALLLCSHSRPLGPSFARSLRTGAGQARPFATLFMTLVELLSPRLILLPHNRERGKRHAFYAAVAGRRADPDHSAAGPLHAPFLKRATSRRRMGRSHMDTLDWVIIAVGAFVALVIAVSAYEAEKRLERIIRLLEQRQP